MKTRHIFSGTHAEIGMQHGTVLKKEIHATLKAYKELIWERPYSEVLSYAQGFKKTITQHLPHLAIEIEAIARGAGLDDLDVYAINARSVLSPQRDAPQECTAIGCKKHATKSGDVILAQNWDWRSALRELTQIVEIRPDNGTIMTMLIEPGMVGKIGFNNHGVGVCLNFLKTESPNWSGLPVHVILRAILESKSTNQAKQKIQAFPRAACANFLVADCEENISNFETRPERVVEMSGHPHTIHTNVFFSDEEPCTRCDLFTQAVSKEFPLSIEQLKSAFRVEGVLQPYEGSKPDNETVHTIIMNLSKGSFEMSDGFISDHFDYYEGFCNKNT